MTKSTENNSSPRRRRAVPEPPPEVTARLEELMPAATLQEALRGLDGEQITGQGGLLQQLAGRLVSAALEGEMADHLGYERGELLAGPAGENVRNGHTGKTIATTVGDTRVKTPRDRAGTFEPVLVAKRQTRLAGLDERIIAMYAGGMSVREIQRLRMLVHPNSYNREFVLGYAARYGVDDR